MYENAAIYGFLSVVFAKVLEPRLPRWSQQWWHEDFAAILELEMFNFLYSLWKETPTIDKEGLNK